MSTAERVREDDAGRDAFAVCPACDLLHRRPRIAVGRVLRCARCGHVLEARGRGAVNRTLAASLAMLALMALAATGPFLTLSEFGFGQTISLIDAAAALAVGWTAPLALFVALAVVVLPALRAGLHLYALLPGRLGRPVPRRAGAALRLSTRLRPWAMAEIFMVGVAVSLVKVAGMADVEPGPAFWALAAAVAVIGFENAAVAREGLWAAVERRG